MSGKVFLSFKKVSKYFPGVIACDKIDLDIYRGEVHTLLGENGAGKSTLMNLLYGLYHVDEGEILIDGSPVSIHSPGDAIDLGIGMIHQHFMLIPVFTVLENIILGQRSGKPPLLQLETFRRRVSEVAGRFGIDVDLDAVVEDLAVGMQQKVEILKALYRGARILILDEPTSVLTPQESQDLFRMLEDLKKQGCTILFISHKMIEVMQISDRITVLRDGKVIETVDRHKTTPRQLCTLMVCRDVSFEIEKEESDPGEEVLRLEGISLQNKGGLFLLRDISLRVCAGEILGIAGVDGNGQKPLAKVISGLQKPGSGDIYMFGQNITGENTRSRIEKGLSYVPADRRRDGLVTDFRIWENCILEIFYTKPFTRGFTLNARYSHEFARRVIREYDIKTPDENVPVKNLSGGNQQRVVIGREISKNPRLLLVVQPTWGLDVAACEFVYNRLLEERDKGTAILLISTELEEVRSLSDRLMVLFKGEIMGEVDPRTVGPAETGLMMAGAKRDKSIPVV